MKVDQWIGEVFKQKIWLKFNIKLILSNWNYVAANLAIWLLASADSIRWSQYYAVNTMQSIESVEMAKPQLPLWQMKQTKPTNLVERNNFEPIATY